MVRLKVGMEQGAHLSTTPWTTSDVSFLGRFQKCSYDFGAKLVVSNSFAGLNFLPMFAVAGISDICCIEDMV